jgi:single-stranded DNA-binding protein
VRTCALGATLLEMAEGTPLVVLGRISAREWQAPGGQTKTFVEVVAESVLVDATMAGSGESVEPAPVRPPVAKPSPAPARPSSPRAASREEKVPF